MKNNFINCIVIAIVVGCKTNSSSTDTKKIVLAFEPKATVMYQELPLSSKNGK
jgi:hypothetical protein